MQAQHPVHVRVFHAARGDHLLRAAVGFLRVLEEQLHPAGQLRAMREQQPRRAELDRHVRVVAAGVHAAGDFGGERKAGRFLHGQGVHVRAQADGRAGQAALDHGDDAPLSGVGLGLHAHAPQALQKVCLRPFLLAAQLRVTVQRAAIPHDFFAKRERFGLQCL